MNYGGGSKLREVTHGKYKGAVQIPLSRYYNMVGFISIIGHKLQEEVGAAYSMNFHLREITLSLSIIIEHSSNEIFKAKQLKKIKNFSKIIKKLDELNYINSIQRKFLDDFRNLRNELAHKKIYTKLYFGSKPLLTRRNIRNLIRSVCHIIIAIEQKSNIKISFDYRKILFWIREDEDAECKR